MAYINFKEEVSAAKDQLNHRRSNNEALYKEIIKDKTIIDVIPSEKYSFKTFEGKVFNNERTQDEGKFSEFTGLNIVCSIFKGCKFYNIKFKNCTFIGCKFKECDFGGGGVIFEDCTFLLEKIKKEPSLNKKDNLSCEFDNCKIYSKFLSCDITYLILRNCNFKDTSFELSDMSNTIIIDSYMKRTNFADVDLSGAKIVNTYLVDFEFNDKLKTKVNEKTFIDKIKPREKTKNEYEGLYMVYETIADKFKENNLSNNFGEYYYICKNFQRKSLDTLRAKVLSFIYFATCGYGERMLHPLITSLILVLLFAILYILVGLDIEGETIIYLLGIGLPKSFSQFVKQFNETLNLSCGIFAGLGMITAGPTPAAYMLSNVEMVLGVIMMGIGIGTITRKLVR
ncbi:pentapeptide repeat-containing protein [Clostridium culturomicium]|uniref:pentapeptide repeat-containing protein n=1 Tax=Clostridium culturomicium TaxID=1499683 RepID=UPI003857EF5D